MHGKREPKRERKNKNRRRKKEIPNWIDECTTLRRKLKAEKTNAVDEKVGKSTRQRKNSNERTSNDNGKTAMRIIWRMWNETDYFRLNSSIFCRWAFFCFRSRRIMSSFSKRISRMTRWKHCCWEENEQEKEKKKIVKEIQISSSNQYFGWWWQWPQIYALHVATFATSRNHRNNISIGINATNKLGQTESFVCLIALWEFLSNWHKSS